MHLVRKVNGEQPFRSFLDSYRGHRAGASHDLVLLFKGFDSEEEIKRYLTLAAGLVSDWISISDEGYDLGAYLEAARQLPYLRLCFLNSYSTILVDGWLEILANALRQPGTGLVGATGSWGSQLSAIRFDLGLGGYYEGVLGDRHRIRELFRALVEEEQSDTLSAKLTQKLGTVGAIFRRCTQFDSFPAHHVRTNAFLVPRDVLLQVHRGRQRDKLDLWILESGRKSVTRQIEAAGRHAVIAGRDGRVYRRDDWASSYVFWQGDQQNLLVADNQTRAYQQANMELRTALSCFAWGKAADPAN